MDYEKAYKEALKRAKGFKTDEYKDVAEYIFPELAKSEDVMIKEKIIATIHLYYGEPLEDEAKEMIAWLEKQGERKSADKVEPKFVVGDIIKPKDGGHEPWQIMQVDISDKKYRFKDGYVIHFSQEDNYELVENPAWSEEDESRITTICTYLQDYARLSGCESRTIRINKYCDWLKSLKDRVHTQPQSQWSEEDFNRIEDALWHTYAVDTATKLSNKVKSLRPQNRWKPSDEQMEALWEVYKGGEEQSALASLYSDLKRLLKI